MKKFRVPFIFFSVLFIATPVHAKSNIISIAYTPMHFNIGGTEYAPPADQQGFQYHDSTYVPLRFIGYALNQSVWWDGQTNSVYIGPPDDNELAEIKKYQKETLVADASAIDKQPAKRVKVEADMQKVHYLFQGTEKQPSDDLPGLMINDHLYVPLRFFAEASGRQLDWDPVHHTVAASAVPAQPEKPVQGSPQGDGKTPEPGGAGKDPSGSTPTAPVPGGAVGGGGSGGGGGGIPSKPTYDALVSAADAKIEALQSSCETRLTHIALQYLNAADADQKAELMTQGERQLSQCDQQFHSILNELQTQLTNYGYDTSVIADYRKKYEEEKAAAEAAFKAAHGN